MATLTFITPSATCLCCKHENHTKTVLINTGAYFVTYTRDFYQVLPKTYAVSCTRSLVLHAVGYFKHCFDT